MLTKIARGKALDGLDLPVPHPVLPVDEELDPLFIPLGFPQIKPPIVKEPEPLKDSMVWNYLCRWIENSKFLGASFRASYDYKQEQKVLDFNQATLVDFDIQVGNLIGNGCGILLALAFHFTFKFLKWYSPTISLNPPYRIFKTLASLGQPAGLLLANTLPFMPKGSQKIFAVILSDIFAIAFCLFTIPHWIIRGKRDVKKNAQLQFKPRVRFKPRLAMVGTEGWSKYAKTAIVLGISIGQAVGAIVSFATGTNMITCLAIGSGISAITCFSSVLILVPLLNKYFNNMLISAENDKDSIRNNYIRSGITLGLALGSTIGFFAFPGLGALVGMTVGAAFASTVMGITLGKYGYKISQYTKKNWMPLQDDTDNSWDYATRNTSYACAFLFSIIGFFLPIPGGALAGAALGSSVGGVLGWFSGLYIIRKARILQPIEQRALTVPWTQRMANGANLFTLLGASAGVGIGMLIGGAPVAMLGATLGLSIGGFLGSVCGVLFDTTALHNMFGKKKVQPEPVVEKKVVEKIPLISAQVVPVFQHIHHLLPPSPIQKEAVVLQQPEKKEEMTILILDEPEPLYTPPKYSLPDDEIVDDTADDIEEELSPYSLSRYQLFKNYFPHTDAESLEVSNSPSLLVACV